MLQDINPTQTSSWKSLIQHHQKTKSVRMADQFKDDPSRFDKFHIQFEDILFDYSKNRIDDETINLLVDLAEECELKSTISAMFSGGVINSTERRSVLHTALRSKNDKSLIVKGADIKIQIKAVLHQMKIFCDNVHSGDWKGYTGKSITDVINIGIGGSDLGPLMVTESLRLYKKAGLNIHFVSNIDEAHINQTLEKLNPATTLFLIASKTFSTQETMTNAFTARDWFLKFASPNDIEQHFIALSTNIESAIKFGISKDNVFQLWDWVGGRYSLWSAIGLSIALGIGYDHFEELLEGAYAMDEHFQNAEFTDNIPILMALMGIWYNNFYKVESHVILPYAQDMNAFAAYLQQVDMESNGKSVDRSGNAIDYQTGPVIWGEPGTNGQHSFYQLLHQGSKMISADFLAPVNSGYPSDDHQQKLLANFFAQPEALMNGKSALEVQKELSNTGMNQKEINKLTPFKVFDGNRPSNSILFNKLTPYTLGSLIAMYEHKVFVQGVIWNIFSFDQWGVELGKQLADNIIPELQNKNLISVHNSSTNGLINAYKKMRTP